MKLSNLLKNFFNNTEYDTVHYVVAMLKKYGIKYIVASPGTQNSFFNTLVQSDNFFKCYSVVDERSAGYVATGIAFETGEPVVISCTGATASRNYMSSLTEAYYRKLPIIALTFMNYKVTKYSMTPQYLDRSISPNDMKSLSIELSKIFDKKEKRKCLTLMNVALMTAKYKKEPVHINILPVSFNYNNISLPTDVWKCDYYSDISETLKVELQDKKIAIFIGSHAKFKEDEKLAIENFAKSYGCPVFCDHTSNYHGANKILTSQIARKLTHLDKPEIIIDIGYVTGDYTLEPIFSKGKIWRISEDGQFRNRLECSISKLFNCTEKTFFTTLANNIDSNISNYYVLLKSKLDSSLNLDLPLCNGLVCQLLSQYIPKNSSLHLSILNTLRNMNYFNLDESIDVNCNVGGFGIDGSMSTLLGQSFSDTNRNVFGIVGDLAFFYDMNFMGNRHINKNIRIILVNNNEGIEFRLNKNIEGNLGDKADNLIAAKGHYVNGAQKWAEACDFEYLQANDKTSFISQIKDFCTKDYDKPVLFEVFTTCKDEQQCKKILYNNSRYS